MTARESTVVVRRGHRGGSIQCKAGLARPRSGRTIGAWPSRTCRSLRGDGISVPCGSDAAASATAQGKMPVHRTDGTPVPEGWIIDRDGRDATDAEASYDGGAMLPSAGPKGMGLAVIAEPVARAALGGARGVVDAERADAARVDPLQAGQAPEQGRLARPVRADQCHPLARPDAQRHAVEHPRALPVAAAELAGDDRRRRDRVNRRRTARRSAAARLHRAVDERWTPARGRARVGRDDRARPVARTARRCPFSLPDPLTDSPLS